MAAYPACESTMNASLLALYDISTEEKLQSFFTYNLYYHSYVSSLVSGVGILGNLMLFIILTRPSMLQHGGHGSVHVILAGIAVADFFTNLTNFIYVVGRLVARNKCDTNLLYSYLWNVFVLIHADASVFLHAVSLYLTVALAILRVFVLSCQTRRRLNEISTGCWSILITTALVGASCLPNFLRNTISEYDWDNRPILNGCGHNFTIDPSAATTPIADRPRFYDIRFPVWWNCTLEKFSFWTYGIMSKIIPCVMLTLFMACLVHIIFTARRRRRRLLAMSSQQPQSSSGDSSPADRTSALLFSIVFIFWLTELPQGVILILSAFDPLIFTVYQAVGDFLDLLSLVNSSINFALYCSMSAKFRQEFVSMIKCNYVNSSTTSSSPPRTATNAGIRAVQKRGASAATTMKILQQNPNNHNATTMDDSVSISLLKKVRVAR